MLDERADTPAKRILRSISALNQIELFMNERNITTISIDEVVDQLAFWEDEWNSFIRLSTPPYDHVPPEIGTASSTEIGLGSRVIIVTCGLVRKDNLPATSVARGAKGIVERISMEPDESIRQYVIRIEDAPDRSLIGRQALAVVSQLVLLH